MKRARWQLRGEVRTKTKGSAGGHYQIPGRFKGDIPGLKKHIEKLMLNCAFLYDGLDLEVSTMNKDIKLTN